MLSQPKELTILMQTRLTLVVAWESGHDPIKASGLLLAYLPGICQRTEPGTPQLWVLRAVQGAHKKPWDQLRDVAEHQNTTPGLLFNEARLAQADLHGAADASLD